MDPKSRNIILFGLSFFALAIASSFYHEIAEFLACLKVIGDVSAPLADRYWGCVVLAIIGLTIYGCIKFASEHK